MCALVLCSQPHFGAGARAPGCPCALSSPRWDPGCWDSPSQACLCAVYPCPGAAGGQRCQSTGTQPGMGQGRIRRSLGLFLVTLGAPGHNIPACCRPLPARGWLCSPWGRIVTLGTRLGTTLSCTPQTPATPEERFSWLLIELHCHRKPRSRSSLEPPVSH